MATAKMTLIGFNNYMESINDDLFKNLYTPAGIDRSLLINNILMLGGEYEVLWGDPFFYQNMIGVWSDKWQHTMEKWYDAINAYFNPVENYDRIEDWVDNASKLSSVKSNDINSETSETARKENAIANDYSKSNGDGTTENTRSAFDAGTYQPHDKSESETNGENISSGMTSADGKTTNSASSIHGSISDADEKHASLHSGRIHGNIGVKTAQSMITESLELYNWNLYDAIAELFIGEMLIYVDD